VNNILNLNRSDEMKGMSLFLRDKPGLIDTVNQPHTEIWNLFKKLKKLDWDENEFDYRVCNVEFKTIDPRLTDIMIRTLGWQWEADSAVSNSIISIGSGFMPADALACLWVEITKNELLHSATYSEISKYSFDDPNILKRYIIDNQSVSDRMKPVSDGLNYCHDVSHKISLGIIDKDSDGAYDAAILFVITLLGLERLQFMSSFAVTFAFAEAGMFVPIAKAVQKICTDEFQVHVQADKLILKNEFATERGKASYNRLKPRIKDILDTIIDTEIEWTTTKLFDDDIELLGLNKDNLARYNYYSAYEIYNFLDIEFKYPIVTKNPLTYMDNWININDNQASAQEEDMGNYLLGGFVKDAEEVMDLDF